MGLLPEPEGTVQRLTILFALLDYLNTRADELPEPVLDCLAECNTVAIVTIRGRIVSIDVGGLPWTSSERRH
jgi:hypothetical protein